MYALKISKPRRVYFSHRRILRKKTKCAKKKEILAKMTEKKEKC